MESGQYIRQRATSIVRTLVVATATLAILLVCFSIYQYSQHQPDQPTSQDSTGAPATDSNSIADVRRYDEIDDPRVEVDGVGVIGPAGRTRFTIYQRHGQQAQLELVVSDWRAVKGSADEFLLTKPEVRMRTKDGHAVRVVAAKGMFQAERKPGGGLEPSRGRLVGNVKIEYDRLTDEERARLPEPSQDPSDPSQLVIIEMEEIEFDLEYSKIVVPGRLRLSAREADLEAGNVEVRFNERENRIESMRIGQGGRLVLREQDRQSALALPDFGASTRRLTLAEWVRATIAAKLGSQQESTPAQEAETAGSTPSINEDGIPVFREDEPEEREQDTPVQYTARFEGNVDARQIQNEVTQVRLEAETLQILRDLSDKDQAPKTDPQQAPDQPGSTAAPKETRIVLEWSERLIVEACTPDDPRCSEQTRSKLTAWGSPARISLPEVSATCTKLTFDPDASDLWLYGRDDQPVSVRFADQGTLTAQTLYSKRDGDDMHILANGPGTLLHEPGGPTAPATASGVDPAAQSLIEFTKELEIEGRFVTRTRINFTGGIATEEHRVLERASFVGDVRIQQRNMGLTADKATLFFGRGRNPRDNLQNIERVTAQGNVALAQDADRMTCRDLDIHMTTDEHGQPVPSTLIALGDVQAQQRDRLIRASDRLEVDFEMVSRPPLPFDAAKAYAKAVDAGLDITKIDWEAQRREREAAVRLELGIARLHASGDVLINDPTQPLELRAEEVDCTVADGRDIQKAHVYGSEDRPANVRLDTFTVTGHEIKVDASDQWAEVPGAGRMTFRSTRDLDGRKLPEPVPIAITWNDWMKYRGRENRSIFQGRVYATSKTTTTFECDRLVVEFDDVRSLTAEGETTQDWWIFQDVVDRFSEAPSRDGLPSAEQRFSKEPTHILAVGKAIVTTSDIDEVTGRVKRRARLEGPRLSVNLRPEVSKLLIEGPGTLLLEDNRSSAKQQGSSSRESSGLFDVDENAGPSNTLIEWTDLMWYDFSIDQTRFEGDVRLTHISGAELWRIRGGSTVEGIQAAPGRRTFLTCDTLIADFLARDKRVRSSEGNRMGRLGASLLQHFTAEGSVTLDDSGEGLSLTAGRVVYERDRRLLAVYGSSHLNARVIIQRPGRLPNQYAAERFFYDVEKNQIEQVFKPSLKSR